MSGSRLNLEKSIGGPLEIPQFVLFVFLMLITLSWFFKESQTLHRFRLFFGIVSHL